MQCPSFLLLYLYLFFYLQSLEEDYNGKEQVLHKQNHHVGRNTISFYQKPNIQYSSRNLEFQSERGLNSHSICNSLWHKLF